MIWRIYYADGSTWNDENGPWAKAPRDGVIAVVVADPDYGRIVYNGTDFYTLLPDGLQTDVTSVDDLGPFLRRYVPAVKFGVQLPRIEYLDVLHRATHDKSFPSPRHPMRRKTDGVH